MTEKFDFSHLLPSPVDMVAHNVERGLLPTDELLADAVATISPPLVSERVQNAILDALREPRRGRPPRGVPPRREIARLIETMDREDLPVAFRQALVRRLRRSRGRKERDRQSQAERGYLRNSRDFSMENMRDQIFALLDGSSSIDHPIFGVLAVPAGAGSKHETALLMTQALLRDAEMNPPSPPAMRNLISKRRKSTR